MMDSNNLEDLRRIVLGLRAGQWKTRINDMGGDPTMKLIVVDQETGAEMNAGQILADIYEDEARAKAYEEKGRDT